MLWPPCESGFNYPRKPACLVFVHPIVKALLITTKLKKPGLEALLAYDPKHFGLDRLALLLHGLEQLLNLGMIQISISDKESKRLSGHTHRLKHSLLLGGRTQPP